MARPALNTKKGRSIEMDAALGVPEGVEYDRGGWRAKAACKGVDPNLFFGNEASEGQADPKVKELCDRCPVSQDCRAYAEEAKEKFGVWGGESQTKRRRRRKSDAQGSAA